MQLLFLRGGSAVAYVLRQINSCALHSSHIKSGCFQFASPWRLCQRLIYVSWNQPGHGFLGENISLAKRGGWRKLGEPSSDKPDPYDMDADGFSVFRIISFVSVGGPIREKKVRSLLIFK